MLLGVCLCSPLVCISKYNDAFLFTCSPHCVCSHQLGFITTISVNVCLSVWEYKNRWALTCMMCVCSIIYFLFFLFCNFDQKMHIENAHFFLLFFNSIQLVHFLQIIVMRFVVFCSFKKNTSFCFYDTVAFLYPFSLPFPFCSLLTKRVVVAVVVHINILAWMCAFLWHSIHIYYSVATLIIICMIFEFDVPISCCLWTGNPLIFSPNYLTWTWLTCGFMKTITQPKETMVMLMHEQLITHKGFCGVM